MLDDADKLTFPFSRGTPLGTRLAPGSLHSQEHHHFGRTNMANLVRGDGGGFLAGSLVAVLAVFGIFFLTLIL